MSLNPNSPYKRVVIVGAGFGGLQAALYLRRENKVFVTLIDRSNHHLFQPLLYQVATSMLSPADIALPVRSVFKRQSNIEILMDEIVSIDQNTKVVKSKSSNYPFDYLILATGARHSYFNNPSWEKMAPGLKTISDAVEIRQRILLAFEEAEKESHSLEKGLLNFVLVGGGPTGVEMAGAIAELSHRALRDEFRRIDPRSARVILIEAGPRLLATFPEELSKHAQQSLEKLGVEVWLKKRVEDISDNGIRVEGTFLPARTIIWAAGVKASPAGQWLGANMDSAGRVLVSADLSLPGHPEIFVIGDTAHCPDAHGQPLPGIAPVAIQQGRFVAHLIQNRIHNPQAVGVFTYKDKGTLATIGRSSAVARI